MVREKLDRNEHRHPQNEHPARIGYARTSMVEQNLDAQIAALEAAGCTMVRTEQKSGASLKDRRELSTILDFIRNGETLVVTRIDRLARSMRDLQIIVDRLKQKGAHLVATEQPVDTSTAAGKAFFDMLGVFAEFETSLRRERQAEGIAAAKTKGIYKGRPPKIDMDDIKPRLSDGERPVNIAHDMGVARSSVYKAKAETVVDGGVSQ
ncbi:recombinase family protein [Phaeobacter sp. C3_T13_0]|uniref:recombinase family protein n=1 Tax=Phaeobacter cretensis TaxID=3342641 RepID=UPI0039BC31EF